MYTIRNHNGLLQWQIRVGIHTGSVIAGIIGKKKFSYDIWGDTVISHYRGKLKIINRDSMDMYFIDGFK